MDIDVKYRAADGRVFDDPIKCGEYEEKEMGAVYGTVGMMVRKLRHSLNPMHYCNAILIVRDKKADKNYIIHRCTLNLEQHLGDFVNVENLTEEQRYESCTLGQLADVLERNYDKNMPVHGLVVYGPNRNMKPLGIARFDNSECWKNADDL